MARLLETYALATGRVLEGYGFHHLPQKKKQAGLEPDECYFVDALKKFPDIAIEVVISRWKLSKLEVYARLGVREVWVFGKKERSISSALQRRVRNHRTKRAAPELDIEQFARFVRMEGLQSHVARAYYDALSDPASPSASLTAKGKALTTSRSRPSGPRSPGRSTPRRRRL